MRECHWWTCGRDGREYFEVSFRFVFRIKHHTCTIVIQTIRFGIESAWASESESQNIDELIPHIQDRIIKMVCLLIPHIYVQKVHTFLILMNSNGMRLARSISFAVMKWCNHHHRHHSTSHRRMYHCDVRLGGLEGRLKVKPKWSIQNQHYI